MLLCHQHWLTLADDLTLFNDLHGTKAACEWVAAYWKRCTLLVCPSPPCSASTATLHPCNRIVALTQRQPALSAIICCAHLRWSRSSAAALRSEKCPPSTGLTMSKAHVFDWQCRHDYEHVPIAGAVNEVCPMGFPGGMSFSFWEDKARLLQPPDSNVSRAGSSFSSWLRCCAYVCSLFIGVEKYAVHWKHLRASWPISESLYDPMLRSLHDVIAYGAAQCDIQKLQVAAHTKQQIDPAMWLCRRACVFRTRAWRRSPRRRCGARAPRRASGTSCTTPT